jgi:glycosyltransferase involved in cell wall biosynthesis
MEAARFASLCVLSYTRSELLLQCLNSLLDTLDYPAEIIVNDDAGINRDILIGYYKNQKISKLIVSNGKNRGVGRSFQNCLGLAEGDFIFKIDTDLIFEEKGWLSTSVRIMDTNPDIVSLSLFNYRHYDPDDKRFNILERRAECNIVDDFVSSIYCFRKEDLARITPVDDDGNHLRLTSLGGKLAITNKDYVINVGFGIGRSTYVSGTPENPTPAKVYNRPFLISAI